jgi:hypothetical protein
VLAYVFWHRPAKPQDADAYEQAQLAFHRSLAHNRPVGMCGSAVFRLTENPWIAGAEADTGSSTPTAVAPSYEDWYLLEDFAALGVLNEAAVGRGHRSPHDEVARRYGGGAGGLYALIEGERKGDLLSGASVAVWVARPPGSPKRSLADLLGDGVEPGHASLWRRALVLGPAPEFCLLVRDSAELADASGVAATRLPEGWTSTILQRENLWHG